MARTFFNKFQKKPGAQGAQERHSAKIVFSPDDLKKDGAPIEEKKLVEDKRDASAPCAARKLGQDSIDDEAPEREAERDTEHGSPCQEEGTGRATVAAQGKSGCMDTDEGSMDVGAANTPRPTGVNAIAETAGENALYDDTDVCQVLGLRKRVLVQHRATSKRGMDWGVCGDHAGMSAKWIRAWNSKADLKRMKPLQPGDGVTTVRVVGHVQNMGVIVAARVSDGTRVMVRVMDARYLHRGDEMDCRTVGGMLSYAPELNRERY